MSTARTARTLRDLAEPIAGCVYFVPEAQKAYADLGLDDYAVSYFGSRGASLGRPSGEVVTAAFGVFNPAIVIPSVQRAWSLTDPDSLLAAREDGATSALRRILGDDGLHLVGGPAKRVAGGPADPDPGTARTGRSAHRALPSSPAKRSCTSRARSRRPASSGPS